MINFLLLLPPRHPLSSLPHATVPAHGVRSRGGGSFQLQCPAGPPHQRLPPLQAGRVHTAGHAEGRPDAGAGRADALRRGDVPAGHLQLPLQDERRLPHSAHELPSQQLHQHHRGYVLGCPRYIHLFVYFKRIPMSFHYVKTILPGLHTKNTQGIFNDFF